MPRAIRTEGMIDIGEKVIAIVTVTGINPKKEGLIKRALPGKAIEYNHHFKRLEIKIARPETDSPEEAGHAIISAANRISNIVAAADAGITQEAVNWMGAALAYA